MYYNHNRQEISFGYTCSCRTQRNSNFGINNRPSFQAVKRISQGMISFEEYTCHLIPLPIHNWYQSSMLFINCQLIPKHSSDWFLLRIFIWIIIHFCKGFFILVIIHVTPFWHFPQLLYLTYNRNYCNATPPLPQFTSVLYR